MSVARRRQPPKNVLAAMQSTHWAMTRDGLDRMHAIAARRGFASDAVRSIESKLGEPVSEDSKMTVRDGVATIRIEGPLFRYANIFVELCGATSYENTARDLRSALDNAQIRGIVLGIDSPGGDCNGCAELAEMIFAARGIKPIVSYVSGDGCSAAYWIASAADEVVVAETALVGSIGTVATIYDTSKRDEATGVKKFDIVSSQSPRKRLSPTSDEGRAAVQAVVDGLAEVFVVKVARNRGVRADDVIEHFGQGGLFVGASSVEHGLADRLGSYEGIHAELAGGNYTASTSALRRATSGMRSNTQNITQSINQESVVEPKIETPATAADAGSGIPVVAAEGESETCSREACGHSRESHPDDGRCTVEGCTCESYSAPAEKPADEPAGEPAAQASAVDPARGTDDGAVILEARMHAARQGERERIRAIRALGHAGEEEIVEQCIDDPTCTPDMAARRLREADSNSKRSRLASLRGDESQVEKPGPTAPAAVNQVGASADAQRILAAHDKATNPKRG